MLVLKGSLVIIFLVFAGSGRVSYASQLTNRMFTETTDLGISVTNVETCANSLKQPLTDVGNFLGSIHEAATVINELNGLVTNLPTALKPLEGIPAVGQVASGIRVVVERFKPVVTQANSYAVQIKKVITPWIQYINSFKNQATAITKPIADAREQIRKVTSLLPPAVGCTSKVESDKGVLSQSVVLQMDQIAKALGDAEETLDSDFKRVGLNCGFLNLFLDKVTKETGNLPDISAGLGKLKKILEDLRPVTKFASEVSKVMGKRLGCIKDPVEAAKGIVDKAKELFGKRGLLDGDNVFLTEKEALAFLQNMQLDENMDLRVAKREICVTVGDVVRGVTAALTGGFSTLASAALSKVAGSVVKGVDIPALPTDVEIFKKIISLTKVQLPKSVVSSISSALTPSNALVQQFVTYPV